jgi:hypothetical protein
MACPGHIDRFDRNQCQVVITRVEVSFVTSDNLHLLRGYWSVLTSPGCPVGDDLSSVLAEISYFARRIRQVNPRASPSLAFIPSRRSDHSQLLIWRPLRQGKMDLWFDEVQLGYPLLMTYRRDARVRAAS